MERPQFIYGRKPVLEALRSDKPVEKIYIDRTMKGEVEIEIRALAREKQIPLSRIPGNAFKKWTNKVHQGVLAVMSLVDYRDISELEKKILDETVAGILVLDHIKDVRNVGAIIRSAICFGIEDIIVPSKNSAEINDITAKSSAGALLQANLYRVTNLSHTIMQLKDAGASVLSLEKKGGVDITTFRPSHPFILVAGSEGHGVTKEMLKLSDHRLAIPHQGDFDSLNVSVATGIALFQLTKV